MNNENPNKMTSIVESRVLEGNVPIEKLSINCYFVPFCGRLSPSITRALIRYCIIFPFFANCTCTCVNTYLGGVRWSIRSQLVKRWNTLKVKKPYKSKMSMIKHMSGLSCPHKPCLMKKPSKLVCEWMSEFPILFLVFLIR